MPTIKQVWQLIQQGDYAVSINLKDAYLHIPIVKHHHDFLWFIWQNKHYHWKVLPFQLATDPRSCRLWARPVFVLVATRCFDMWNVYHSPANSFSSFYFSDSALCQLQRLSQLHQGPVPLHFPLPDVVIAIDATPTHWAFYLQDSGLSLSMSGSWSGCMCRLYITTQELQTVKLMFYRLAFQFMARYLPWG